ncbi:bifunctional DNA-formamidopyrimidine glycosylase/DNA-(apurinic or apyrimidinic site) lyase [Paenibacillus thermotolerans]|uniref:bifunctional DNA-formamidopyrimidine glycosylase/DNA-(apurinic or apyrimidinic site) lyase n=1 Tax=Paenibacillus thermotolerans TaxID=3027807 RepID=UPI00236805EF|nr:MULTISPECIES: bifunctional DNA-formamidopyrimidine glycosylase/DNA-(apurinic or apyrimidinic site) lyase [unclassified Paenibacillus]
MPELPEMETYRMQLTNAVAGRTIETAEVTREKTINVPVAEFIETVSGSRIDRIDRRAKMLLFRLDNGATLLLHLMLGGSMFWGTEEEAPDRTAQVKLVFVREDRRLFFHGLRLGYLHLYQEDELARKLAKLGPDALAPSMNAETFAARIRKTRGALKSALTDQSVISGIGNCYSDELCFLAGIQPLRTVASLDSADWGALYTAMHSTFAEAIRYGGYMETPFFAGDTHTGGYNDRCKVYDRGGEPCFRCGAAIVKSELAGRKVFYCEQCQAGVRDEVRRLSHQH